MCDLTAITFPASSVMSSSTTPPSTMIAEITSRDQTDFINSFQAEFDALHSSKNKVYGQQIKFVRKTVMPDFIRRFGPCDNGMAGVCILFYFILFLCLLIPDFRLLIAISEITLLHPEPRPYQDETVDHRLDHRHLRWPTFVLLRGWIWWPPSTRLLLRPV
jgi:hypothetical protein